MKQRFLQILTVALGASLAGAQDTPPPTRPAPGGAAPAGPAAAGERGEAPRPPRPNGEQAAGERPPGEPGGPEDGGPGGRGAGRPPRRDGPDFDRPVRPNGERPRRSEADDGQGRRGDFGADDRPGLRREGRPPERLQPYVGVVTRPAMPELSAQLRQTEGFGLVVDDLLPESPAQIAGLQRNDFLVRFDDQLLVNPQQLEALVRRAGKDHEIALTILRGGTEQKITLKIGEKLLPERRPLPGMGMGTDRFPGNIEREFGPRGEDGGPLPRAGVRGEFWRGGDAAGDGNRETFYAPERARIVRQDGRGSYELSMVDGQPNFAVKKPDGTVAWQGPVKTPEQRQAVPAEFQEKLTALEAARSGPRFPRDNFPPRGGQPNDGDPRDGQPGNFQPREGQPRNAQPRDGQGWGPRPGATDPVGR